MAILCNRAWAHLSGKQLVILYFPQMQVLWDQADLKIQDQLNERAGDSF